MGIPVLILGESGSGKSASLRNFEPSDVSVFNVASKPLPFRKRLPVQNMATYQSIADALSKPAKKAYVIDDAQYLMCFDLFSRIAEKGYEKFAQMALSFYSMVQFVIRGLPPDCIVYFMMHTDTDANGKIKAKTVGKMLDEKLTLEGLFSIVLMTEVTKEGYFFVTQSDGFSSCKSPMDMFPLKIDNDLKMVDETIRAYWGLTASPEGDEANG